MLRPGIVRAAACVGYVGAAVVFTWPLVPNLTTHVPGPLSGDTGVYIWNLWAFAHEASNGRLPLFTSTVFALAGPVDLSLHNYTLAMNLVAWLLLAWHAPSTVYNLLLLLTLTINGLAGFAVARRVTGHAGVAWIAGLLFGFSPFVLARATGHLSLVAVAPLAVFWLALDSWRGTGRLRYAAGVGVAAVWALYSDPYYAVYCAMIAALFLAPVRVRREARPGTAWRRTARGIDTLIAVSATLGVVILLTGGWDVTVGHVRVRMLTAYTPMLLASALAMIRWLAGGQWEIRPALDRLGGIRPGSVAVAGLVTVALASPWLYALAQRLMTGGGISEPVMWRSSVPGVDLLGFFMPNPLHPLAAPIAAWLSARPGGLIENVVAVPLAVWGVIVLAIWRGRWIPPRWWAGLGLVFGVLALGPFVQLAGVNTQVPGPWALLRFAPFLSSARSPGRFAAVALLALAILFGAALRHLMRRSPRRRWLLAAVGVLLAVELWPAPRPLYSAAIPEVYRVMAADPRSVRVMHLPFGLRDGTRTIGGYNTARLYYQTHHEKASLGGYVSRLAPSVIRQQRRVRTLRALLHLSSGGRLLNVSDTVRRQRGARFARYANLGYVVINRAMASSDLVHFATVSFGLEFVARSEHLELYRVTPLESIDEVPVFAALNSHALGVTNLSR